MTLKSDRDESRAASIPQAAGEEGFLRRWSRRKQVAQRPAPDVAEHDAAPAAAPLTDANMPPIESLTEDSDYSVFMSPGVSEELRGAALRRLFRSPRFNERCPLDSEYYDCHGFTPLGSIVTHEMREELEREAAKLKEQARSALLDTDGSAQATSARGSAEVTEAAQKTDIQGRSDSYEYLTQRRKDAKKGEN